MNNRPKKPPIVVGEQEHPEEEPGKGPLTYAERNRGGGGTKGGRYNWIQMFLSAAVAVLITLTVGTFMFLGKGDGTTLLDNQKLLESRITTEVGTINDKFDGYVKTSSLGSYVSQADFNGLSQVVAGKVSLSEFNTLKTTLEGKVDTKLGEVDDKLEEVGSGSSFFDYYLDGSTLWIKVGREGYYKVRLTLIEKGEDHEGFIDGTVLEYYTGSHKLDPNEWVSGDLDHLEEDLEDAELGDLSDYDIYVEVLSGNIEDTESGGSSW